MSHTHTLWCTEITAKCPKTNELTKYAGPHVPGITKSHAEWYCEQNGLGYCKVIGILVAEIPCKENTAEPDWEREIDYEIAICS